MPKQNKRWGGNTSAHRGYTSNKGKSNAGQNNASRQYGSSSSTETECDRVCATIPRMSHLVSLSEQMAYAYGSLSLTTHDHEIRKAFMASLEEKFRNALRGFAKYCFLYAFGSSINELGMKNCDLDLVLVTNGEINTHWPGPIPDTRQLLNVIMKLLYRDQSHIGITSIVPIRGARVPLVKFKHVSTDIDCDVSFNRRMGVLNSRLIARLMQFDESAKLLAFTVRLWGKQKNFVGGGGIKINSYSMTLMVIFFLQQIGVLPALKLLQHPGNTIKDSIEGESFYVTMQEFEPFRGTSAQYNLSEMLTGFLGYYIKFPFETKIISVYHGEPLAVADYPRFNAQLMNVQDPFDKSFNTTRGVKPAMKAWFRKCLALTWSHRAVLCNPSGNGDLWGLQYLFQPISFDSNKKRPKCNQRQTNGANSDYARNMADYHKGDGRILTIDIPYRQSVQSTDLYVRYCVEVVRALRQIFEMTIEAPSLNHPLSDAIRQSLSRKRPSSDTLRVEDRFQSKQARKDMNHSSVQHDSPSVRPHQDLAQSPPKTSSGETKVSIEYYIPYTVQVRNRVPNLRNTSSLDKTTFIYDKYLSYIAKLLKNGRMVHGSDFTISFQPHDAQFGTVDMEIIDIDTGCIESIQQHISTVLPHAIQDSGASSVPLIDLSS